MKREKLLTLLIAWVLAFCVSFGGVACVLTGFQLSKTEMLISSGFAAVPVDIGVILVFCVLFSGAAALAFMFRRGGWFLLGGLALLLGYFWRTGALLSSVESMFFRISSVYNSAYRWGVIRWSASGSVYVSADLAFCILAGIPAVLTARAVCRRKCTVPAVLCGSVLLGLCLVVTDTVPAVWCLMLLLTGLVLLVLTGLVRRRSEKEGNRLTALLLIPAVLYMSLLFLLLPQDGYRAEDSALRQSVMAWLQNIPFEKLFDTGFSGNSAGAVDLANLGPRIELSYAVMDVTGAKDGMLYLRGQALDAYNGKKWDTSKASRAEDNGWPTEGGDSVGTVTISTVSGKSVLYFPYYPSGINWPDRVVMSSGGLANPRRIRQYSFVQMDYSAATGVEISSQLREQCLQLPDTTRIRAAKHLQAVGVDESMSTEQIARCIGSYVRDCARYDLNTDTMPSYENDFVMWFLLSAEKGYCVHFASAAAVLLRAAGVPARYVSGYVINAREGEAVTVTENRAHAWVEYFVSGKGWQVLDPTPSSWYGEEIPPDTQPTETAAPSESTEPSETQEPAFTEPTQPQTQPSQPSADPSMPAQDPITGTDPEQKADLSWLWTSLLWLAGVAAAVLAAAGQYLLRRRLRSRRMHRGHPNQRALARWREVLRISKLVKEKPPQQLLELAEKARFSQHTLTVAERMEFDRHLDQAAEKIGQMPWLKRWLIRLIWAVE